MVQLQGDAVERSGVATRLVQAEDLVGVTWRGASYRREVRNLLQVVRVCEEFPDLVLLLECIRVGGVLVLDGCLSTEIVGDDEVWRAAGVLKRYVVGDELTGPSPWDISRSLNEFASAGGPATRPAWLRALRVSGWADLEAVPGWR